MKTISKTIEKAVGAALADSMTLAAREDSRAFGAMIESHILANWPAVCSALRAEACDAPGRRTIYDAALILKGAKLGFDVKTKDLDSNRYSDGGVCAVSNLLTFLANERAQFFIVEIAHRTSLNTPDLREIQQIRVAPFHVLPADSYRIENLGTGQVRLNFSIAEMYDRIEWSRSLEDFFEIFTDLCIKHYERVANDAAQRILAIEQFRETGYVRFRMRGAR